MRERIATWIWNARWRLGYWIGGFDYASRDSAEALRQH